MKRFMFVLTTGTVMAFQGPCLPDGYFSELLGSSVSALTSLVLTDFVDLILMQ